MSRSFPFYQQLDTTDCGAACLKMVARHFGRFYSLDRLRELTYIGKEGVSLLGISDAAEHIGLQSLAVKTTFDRLADDIPLPCIAHWNQEHFVVIHKVTQKNIWVADPAAGKFKLSKAEFLENWTSDREGGKDLGVLLILETTPEFFQGEEEKADKAGFRYLFSYLKKYSNLIFQIVLGLLLGSILQLIFPFFTKSIVDIGIRQVDVSFVGMVIIAQVILLLTQVFVNYFRNRILIHVGVRVNISIISDFLIKLTRLPLRFFDSKKTGDLLQRIADHQRVERFLTSTTLTSIFSFFNLFAFAVILAYWSATVFFIFFIGIAINLAWVFFFQRLQRDIEYKRFDQSAENQSSLVELINGMQEVKLHNAEKQKRWAWERIEARLFRTGIGSLNLEQLQHSGAQFINESKNLVITLVVAKAVIDNTMTLGMLVAILYIIGQLNSPLNKLVDFFRSMQQARISLERMNEIHLQDNEENIEEKITILPESGNLILENVSFQYSGPHSPMVLKNISLKIPKGKTTAIVGSSGSGKTTLLKLLLNFYNPVEGKVRLGDISLTNIHSRLWRDKCGAVMQSGFIFNDNIARNIALGDDVIDKYKLLKAVKVANIQNTIESLPLGYNTKIGQEGLGLSQGQTQRLLIARIVYKNPDYIFFDEATNSLDAFNELIIMENLEDFFRNKTVVIVAHRLSTVMHADNIVVLEKGELVEQGNHEELTYVRGAYYHLVKNQLELGS